MTTKMYGLNEDNVNDKNISKKYPWYWAPIFCCIWFLLYYVAVIPSFYSYPKTLMIRDEQQHPDEFIGERAQLQLLALSSIGIKMSGSIENEVYAINYLVSEIEKIKRDSRTDLYDIEIEVQYSSGDFMLWNMASSYRNVTNVIAKISPINTSSQSYLLVNSHFDTEVGSPGAADDGVMVVIMLETLRVISISEKQLKNPIVFLLNGAEEANLLAAHGFITQHRWAPFCKALINLDSAGSGGREILFQSGPNHPWLMKYYKQSAKHPFANTIAEELFQNDFIPSDTDFRVFRDYRGVPGLDMAHTLNGYVYHTKFDNFANLERGTYQTTGDNVLALTWAVANSYEIEKPEDYSEGHTIFFDYLGWFMVFYTETTGLAVNIVVCVCALLVICSSVIMMARTKSGDTMKVVLIRFGIISVIQIASVLLAVGVTLLIAVIIDAVNLSQFWYTETWLIFGIYFCPIFFTLTIFPAIFISWSKQKTNMSLNDTIACFMHAHCIILVLICLVMTGLNIRSAYFPMIAIFFYTISVIFNTITRVLGKECLFIPIHLIYQLLPFWFYTFLGFAFLKTFIPMQGRDGPENKPEIFLSGIVVLISLHFAAFILPILYKFRKTKTLISAFAALFVIFIIIAATPVGFPYRKDVSCQRFYVLHTERIIHNYDGDIVKHNTGYYIQPVDTHPDSLDDTTFKNILPPSWIDEQCSTEMFCGMPLYSFRWMEWKGAARWLPAEKPNYPHPTELKLKEKLSTTPTTVHYAFELNAADTFVMYIEPTAGAHITKWSFDMTLLDENYNTPYFIYHSYSFNDTAYEFWFDIEYDKISHEGPSVRIAVGSHFLHYTNYYTDEFRTFLKTFPDWVYPTNWMSYFESWIY